MRNTSLSYEFIDTYIRHKEFVKNFMHKMYNVLTLEANMPKEF